MSDELDPKSFYTVVVTCPICSSRVRGSKLLRAWRARPEPSFDDAEHMQTVGAGRGRIKNERASLWAVLAAIPVASGRYRTGERVGDFFRLLSRRADGIRVAARDAAYWAKYGK